ncbi:MAG: type II secretion system F family protein [Candidatus Woesearchaeota archaeon]
MRLKFRKVYFGGISAGLFVLLLNFLLFFSFTEPIGPKGRFFYPLIIIGISVGWAHFWIDVVKEIRRQKRIEDMFLQFVRNMKTAVMSGISIPSAVIQASQKPYSELDPYIKKLANQIKLGIPIHVAFVTFANDTGNKMIRRVITIVIEAEASGGDISTVLEAVTESLSSVKNLQEEQKSAVFSQIIQGYVVYFIFIIIMLVLQLKLFPKLTELGGNGGGEGLLGSMPIGGSIGGAAGAANLDGMFLMLILIQGFFAGIMIGKFSGASLKQGFLHSLILVTLAALIITTAKGGI